MNECTLDRKVLLKFLAQFGKDLRDLTINIHHMQVEASVGNITHYIRNRMDAVDTDGTSITINDVPRLVSFIKASTSENATMAQSSAGKTLHVTCGNNKLQLPSSTYVASQREVGLVERLVKQSEDNMWTKWVDFPLDYSATVNTGALYPVVQMTKVIGDKLTCRMEFCPSEGEMVIHAGKKVRGTMFVRVPLIDAVGTENRTAKSAYGYWLPMLLDCLPAGEVNVHVGEDTVLVFRQDPDFLLIVMDQQYEED